MARMTATDLVNFTRKRIGNPSTDEWPDASILRWVNMAQERLAAEYMPETLETSVDISAVSGTATYDLETVEGTILKINCAKNVTDGGDVKPTNRQDYNHDTQGITVPTGHVYRYLESGIDATKFKQVTLQNTPASSQTIRFWYTKTPTELVLSPTATTSDLPRRFDESILDIAAEIGKKFDQQMREAQSERQLASEPKSIAADAGPNSSERRWGIEAPVAPSTKTRV